MKDNITRLKEIRQMFEEDCDMMPKPGTYDIRITGNEEGIHCECKFKGTIIDKIMALETFLKAIKLDVNSSEFDHAIGSIKFANFMETLADDETGGEETWKENQSLKH